MRRTIKTFFALFLIIFVFNSCKETVYQTKYLVECPEEIANNVLFYAREYVNENTVYEYGGQDLLRSIRIDCSGLVVNCYNYAINETGYFLPFDDAAVINFFREWSVKTLKPRPGDLIFMGDNINAPDHMAIFVKKENENIYFIDSTIKPEYGINGVSERYYSEGDNRFLSFGVMLLQIN
jgi:hypothetical protein